MEESESCKFVQNLERPEHVYTSRTFLISEPPFGELDAWWGQWIHFHVIDTTSFNLLPVKCLFMLDAHQGRTRRFGTVRSHLFGTTIKVDLLYGEPSNTFRVAQVHMELVYQGPTGRRKLIWGMQNNQKKTRWGTDLPTDNGVFNEFWINTIYDLDDARDLFSMKLTLFLKTVEKNYTCHCESQLQLRPERGISLSTYFLSSKFSDFEVSVGGRIFPCHRIVLAASSPVLAQMFEHPTKENLEGRWEIEDLDSETMKQVLHFVYTGTCDGLVSGDAEIVVGLHRFADRYMMRQLKARCTAVPPVGITVENAEDLWEEATFFELESLKRAVKEFCWKNKQAVINGSPLRVVAKKCFTSFLCPKSVNCTICNDNDDNE